MSIELERESPFFEGVVPAKIESDAGVGNESTHEEMINVRILSGIKKSPQGQRIPLMHMEVTRENDLFFLYTLQVSEEEFHTLRSEQSLLVDFASFPPKFVELLQGCVNGKIQSGGPNYIAVLDLRGLPVFKVVEANQFKQLTHLSLRVQPATDTILKSYLAERLRVSQRLAKETKDRLDASQNELHQCKLDCDAGSSKLRSLENELENTRQKLKAEYDGALAKQKEDAVKLLSQTQAAASEQSRKQQELSEKRIHELESKLSVLQSDHRKDYEGKTTLESENHQLKAKVATLENAAKEDNLELANLRAANRSLEGIKFELEKNVNEQQLSLAALRQKIQDKEEILSKTSAMLEEATSRKINAEEKASSYKATIGKLQRKLELSIKEINKGNSVIEELQRELLHANDKIKTKNMVIRQQESVLDGVNDQLQDAHRNRDRLVEQLNTEKTTVADLKVALEQSRTKLEECNKLLESNQNVITFLNKEINQTQFGRPSNTSPMTPSLYVPNQRSPTQPLPFHGSSNLFPSPTGFEMSPSTPQAPTATRSPAGREDILYSDRAESEPSVIKASKELGDDLSIYLRPEEFST